jgi:hypothetical protein
VNPEKSRSGSHVSMAELLRLLTAIDWIFAGLSWLTLWYLALNVFDKFNVFAGSFDFLPIAVALPAIAVGWWGFRIGNRVELAINRLDSGVGLKRSSEDTIEAFRVDLYRTVRWWSLATATILSLIMAAVFFFENNHADARAQLGYHASVTPIQILRSLVMVCVGFVIGYMIGRLIGYGNLHRVMNRNQIQLANLSTPESQSAMKGIESVYEQAVFISMGLCAWFTAWWLVWSLGFDPGGYRDSWRSMFFYLWLVSIVIYVLAARLPIEAFSRRLDELYGGSDARVALDIQLAEAGEDLSRINAAEDPTEITELQLFIQNLKARQLRSPWLRTRFLDFLIVTDMLAFGIAWWFGK